MSGYHEAEMRTRQFTAKNAAESEDKVCLSLPWSAVRNIIMIAVAEEEEEEGDNRITLHSILLC